MTTLNTLLKDTLTFARHYPSRSRCRQQLLGMSDRHLQDIGVSRSKLEAGVSSWPWAAVESAVITRRVEKIHQAVTELNSYSDNDLQDLGLNRSTLAKAVRKGKTASSAAQPLTQAA